jgi:hypothetical protein
VANVSLLALQAVITIVVSSVALAGSDVVLGADVFEILIILSSDFNTAVAVLCTQFFFFRLLFVVLPSLATRKVPVLSLILSVLLYIPVRQLWFGAFELFVARTSFFVV